MSQKSVKGTIGEHKKVVDLLNQGYYVAKAVDPQCPFDLVAVSPKGVIKLIDVKTTSFRKNVPKTWIKSKKINRVLTSIQRKLKVKFLFVDQRKNMQNQNQFRKV